MTRDQLVAYIVKSKIFQHWHWFHYHFSYALYGRFHPLADAIINACLDCNVHIPGYAKMMIDRIAAIGGREKHLADWEQLLQILAEIHVVRQVLCWTWPEGTQFKNEPKTMRTSKSPELTIHTESIVLGIEVKAPSLFRHQYARMMNSQQIASRFCDKDFFETISQSSTEITWPRDNPVKDFLVSANAKFSYFSDEKKFVGILVIVWDDFIYEPISALIHLFLAR